ncbi:four-carbon acid sugar kinase family protein [Mitsuokella jalaludinii]|uniref:four-carbon acid sugar kinase family protein n=1 Tax=Mitsuokella jalaludinii TaxID=187979 RepID=UPI003F981C7E
MVKLAAIADDLTGANDTALQFAKRQMRASVQLDLTKDPPADSEVIVVDSDSRDLNAREAYQKVHRISEAVKKYGAGCIYKKIDSTLRGNWGAEVKAVADIFDPELVIIAPAYPVNKRITVGGYHLLNGTLLELTEIGHAPKTPVKKSYIPDILQEQVPGQPCSILDFTVMRQGEEAVRSAIEESLLAGKNWIICDIVEEQNFLTLMDALRGHKNILWAGSAGLADYMAYFYGWRGEAYRSLPARKGPVLVCAGSVSHVTQLQIRTLCQHTPITRIKLDVEAILADADYINQYGEQIQSELAAGHDVLLTAAEDDLDVRKAVHAGRRYQLSGKEVSEKIANIMAAIVSRLDLADLSGMVLTGGDTAVHICRAIGIDRIEILQEVDPGVPLGYLCGERAEPVFVVTKAGAFGKPDTFVKSLNMIKKITEDKSSSLQEA